MKSMLHNLIRKIKTKWGAKLLIHSSSVSNKVTLGQGVLYDCLEIYMLGNNNRVTIKDGGNFKRYNRIFIQGDNNSIEIGERVVFDQNVNITVAEGTSVRIGNDCIIANGVKIRTSDQHEIFGFNGVRINTAKNVIIGSHVWLGNSVVVMKGTTIGDGTVIGINSMVLKDIPKNCVAVGTPAKVIKENIKWKE